MSQDERFKKVHTDPRFIKAKRDAHKVVLDSRFAHMLKSEEFGSLGGIDKRGKKRDPSLANDLKRFYKVEGDESSSGDERPDLARGEGLEESSDEDEIDDSASESTAEQGPWADEDIPTGEETRRFAAVHMDWSHIKAKDLYKVFEGFKPSTGSVLSVKIYPSEFGKERMAAEALQGPPKTVFQGKNEDTEEDDEYDEGKDFNTVALRKYEFERLKYYFAVVECDSLNTAKAIFQACDGSEYESSANFFDLRYIPDDMEFTDEPTDVANSAPQNYKPAEFVTQALQHSNVKLTWDDEDPERVKTTRRKFTKDDLNDMDFKAYLASDSDDDVDEDLKQKYRSLIGGSDDEDAGEEMEITFTPGLTEKAEKMLKDREDREVILSNFRNEKMKQFSKQKEGN
jgi:hypothetical protein